MWVNPNAHCASCVPSTIMLGRASEASSVEVTRKQCIGDLARVHCMQVYCAE